MIASADGASASSPIHLDISDQMHYRAEIDGLRAVAVLPVILFHAGFSLFSGGYVGVDIFFVISGYLITSIILKEMEEGRFSIITFYERRARRILPALFLVMAVSIPFAWMWLIPTDFKEFSKSIVAVMLFSSNVLFWQSSGYFETAVDLKPLLHTWSLAVEEQYYLLFPVFLLMTWRLGRPILAILVSLLIILSLSLAQFASAVDPTATFYLLPMRGWEMGIGALAAIYTNKSGVSRISMARDEILAMLGLALIAASIVLYDEHTPFPSLYTLAPTVGTVLVILYCTPSTLAGRLLTTRIMVGVGLISYSAYLWHQPLFAMARHRSVHEPGLMVFTLLGLCSLALGYASWKFVEAPFRDKMRFSRQKIFIFSGVGMIAFLCFGMSGYLTDGFRGREKWHGVEHAFKTQQELGSGEKFCRETALQSALGPRVCIIGDASKQPVGVLWGDSYAGALLHGLNKELRQAGQAYYAVLSDGCVPVPGIKRIDSKAEFGCSEERHHKFVEEFLHQEALQTVVWVGRFSGVLNGASHKTFAVDGHVPTPSRIKQRIIDTLQRFKAADKHVVFVGDTPRFPHQVADYAIRRYAATDGDHKATVQKVTRISMTSAMNQSDLLTDARRHAKVVDALQLFCSDSVCESHDASGRALFIDRNHVSHIGSERLAKEVMRQLKSPVERNHPSGKPGLVRQG